MFNKAMFSAVLVVSSIWFSHANAECLNGCDGYLAGPIETAGVIDYYGEAFVFAIIDATSEVSTALDDTCHHEDGNWLVVRAMDVAGNSAATITANAMQDVLSAGQSGTQGQVMGFYYQWSDELDLCVMTAIATMN